MDSGALVPDDIIIEVMIKAIEQAPDAGFILDGFPRTVNQAMELDKSLARADQKIDIILNLEVDVQIIENRITGRRSCPVCGAVYHIENMKPRIEGLCDNDDAELIQRPDDTINVVANRLETYHRQTEPLVEYYKNNCTVFNINANMDADSVKASVFEKLDALVKT
jgi:adenylate kinase